MTEQTEETVKKKTRTKKVVEPTVSESVEEEPKQIHERWFTRYWRPAMAWQYLLVCLFDFLILPLMYTNIQARGGALLSQWEPITLNGGGLYHVAMGAILSIYTYNRTQERLEHFKKNIWPSENEPQ